MTMSASLYDGPAGIVTEWLPEIPEQFTGKWAWYFSRR
jgi:hypothetical protein